MSPVSQERAIWLAQQVLPHEPALRAWLRRRTTTGLDVDDIVQEAYAILAGLPSVQAIRNPRAYLFTVARSVVLQYIRHSRVVSIDLVAEIDRWSIDEGDNEPERMAGEHQQLRRLAQLLAALPDKCRQAFVLRKVHGLNQQEIAATMKISENTVEKHIGKGLRLLMQAMATGRDAHLPTPEPERNDNITFGNAINEHQQQD